MPGACPSSWQVEQNTPATARLSSPSGAPEPSSVVYIHTVFPATVPRDSRPRPHPAQVDGCPVTLEPNPLGKQYNIRYRLCDEHLRAERVLVQGHPQRFCQARGPAKCTRKVPV